MNTVTTPKPIHGAPKSWIVEELKTHYRGYTDVAPEAFPFKVGNAILYTNDNGATAKLTIKGFTTNDAPEDNGRTVYVFDDCWWFAVRPESLSAYWVDALAKGIESSYGPYATQDDAVTRMNELSASLSPRFNFLGLRKVTGDNK